jgi:hypothetical protein
MRRPAVRKRLAPLPGALGLWYGAKSALTSAPGPKPRHAPRTIATFYAGTFTRNSYALATPPNRLAIAAATNQ